MAELNDQREKKFSVYCQEVLTRAWKERGHGIRGIRFGDLSEYEREIIALIFFNSDYGGNGLDDYIAWHGCELLEHTLRGLVRIGATQLASVVREYYDILHRNGFLFDGTVDVSSFIDAQPHDVQARLKILHAEACDLYTDFYSRWWRYHYTRNGAK